MSEQQELLARWLELDKTVDHDGDAEASEAEREQWKIEHKLAREFGLELRWNLASRSFRVRPPSTTACVIAAIMPSSCPPNVSRVSCFIAGAFQCRLGPRCREVLLRHTLELRSHL